MKQQGRYGAGVKSIRVTPPKAKRAPFIRKKRPLDKIMGRNVQVLFTESQYKYLSGLAEKMAGGNLSEYIRRQLFGVLTAVPLKK